MSFNNLLLSIGIGLICLSAFANKSVHRYSAFDIHHNVTYIEGFLGYNRYAISDVTDPASNVVVNSIKWDNGTGNLAFGANIGYQISQYFSAELGGIYSREAKISYRTTNGMVRKDLSARPWYTFLVSRISLPLSKWMSLFTKLGLGYQKLVINSPHLGTSAGNVGAVFGAGLIYNLTPAFYINTQWLRFTGKIEPLGVDTTAPNIFLFGIGCKF